MLGWRGSDLRWGWDYPEPGAAIKGRTLIVDGWIAGCPEGSEAVIASGDHVLGASRHRHARPDIARAHLLADDAVGFHLEVDVREVAVDSGVTVSLAVREPAAAMRTLAERTFSLADPDPLPYEIGFRDADQAGHLLRREHIYTSGPPVLEVFPETLALMRRYAGPHVLDLGCGAGPYSQALRTDGRAVQALEYVAEPARMARTRGVPVVRADGRRMPFRDGTFDTVIAVEVIEHIERPGEIVAEAARVTRERILVSVPNAAVIPHLWPWGVVPWHLLEASHVNFFSARSLETLLRQSFAHVAIGYYARSFAFPGAPPLYAHLFAVASHSVEGLGPAATRPATGWTSVVSAKVRRLLGR
jgi:SAM-dependent methyltransferase